MKKLLLCIAMMPIFGFAQTLTDNDFDKTEIVTGLDTPWEMLWGPDDKIWITERPGRVKRINPETKQVELLLTISEVYENSETGLLGMALHPDFENGKPYVYLVYTYQKQSATNGILEKLVRYSYANNQLSSPLILLDNILANTTHVGSRLMFLPDKTLLMTTGEAQNQPLAQNTSSINGKVLRMNDDGTVPANNPIANSLVYTFGHRNPQGLAYGNGKIYAAEHGANIDDEINILVPNRNYGWPNVEGPCNTTAEQTFCTQNNVVPPIWSSGSATEAVAGLDYYGNDLRVPQLRNSLLLVSLKFNTTRGRDLRIYKLNTDGSAYLTETILLNNVYGRMRDICISPAGDIYVSTSNQDGRGTPTATDDRIIKLRYNGVISGFENTSTENNLIVYPNPFENLLKTTISNGEAVKINQLDGLTIKNTQVTDGQIDLSDLEKGMYLLQYQNYTYKICKE
jgi:aldose sugar dehydrogenase